jgi:HEAT repeat protein
VSPDAADEAAGVPDREATARRRQVALAGHQGDSGAARAALDDPEPAVRATALGALARIGALAADDLAPATGDGSPAVRARAAELCIRLGEAGVALVAPLLADRSPQVAEAACFALGEIGEPVGRHPDAIERLVDVAGSHADPLCREAAVAALGAIGAPEGLPAVLAATMDKPAVRRRATLALAAFEGPEVDEALRRALTDRDWQVRQAAEDLTGRTS